MDERCTVNTMRISVLESALKDSLAKMDDILEHVIAIREGHAALKARVGVYSGIAACLGAVVAAATIRFVTGA